MSQAIGYIAIGFGMGFFVAIVYTILVNKYGNGDNDADAS